MSRPMEYWAAEHALLTVPEPFVSVRSWLATALSAAEGEINARNPLIPVPPETTIVRVPPFA